MAYMQKEGTLLRGEHNLLAEAFLIMASAAGYIFNLGALFILSFSSA